MTLTSSLPAPLISATDLRDAIAAGANPLILDVRFERERSDFREDYEAGHVPGALYVELGQIFAGPGGGTAGNRPLPDLVALQNDLRGLGHDAGRPVVITGQRTDTGAARAWFVLTWAGVAGVRVLDGGIAAWAAAGLPLETGPAPAVAQPGTITLATTPQLPVLDADGIANHLAQGGRAYDARGKDGYVKGHIPGAKHLASGGFVDAEGHLLPAEQILARAAAAGLTPDAPGAVYCGGGMAASLATLALVSVGITPGHFVGSFSAWSADPARPVTKGEAA